MIILREYMHRDFVELASFEKAARRLNINDDQLAEIQNYILNSDNLLGTNIGNDVYKIRYKLPNTNSGKRGGIRIIYIDVIFKEKIYLVTAYSKKEKSDLTSEEYKVLKELSNFLQREGV